MKTSAPFTGRLLERLRRLALRALGSPPPVPRDVERALREADVLSEVAGWISATLDLSTVLGAITEAAREVTGAEIAIVAVEEPGGRMAIRQAAGLRGDPKEIEIEPGRGVAGMVLDTGGAFRTDDYLNDSRMTRKFAAAAAGEGVRAMMAVPVRHGQRVEGLIIVGRRAGGGFSDADERGLARLATYAAVAITNAHLFDEAQRARHRLELLSRGLLEVQESERRDLARELHDQTGQLLTALTMNLESLRRAAPPGLETPIGESLAIVQRVLREVRDLSFRLRPAMLDDMGLIEALRWHVDREARRAGLRATVRVDPAVGRLPAPLETALFRVVQEAMTNVARHARASSCAVEIRGDGACVQLLVADDGIGFDPEADRDRLCLGLIGMQERVALVGGSFEIESVPGHGTEVRARIPVPTAARGEPTAR
jgi:signal transduction histidine kinase